MTQSSKQIMLVITDPVHISGSLVNDAINLTRKKDATLTILCILPDLPEHYASLSIEETALSVVTAARSHIQDHIDRLNIHPPYSGRQNLHRRYVWKTIY